MISIARHINHFDPEQLTGTVTVCGAGAIGSRVVLELIKLGITDIRVFDFDHVSTHNISNQAFEIQHINTPKVFALKDIASRYEVDLKTAGELTKDTIPTPYLFMCADDMEVRKNILKQWTMNPLNKVCIESRMSFDEVRIYTLTGMTDYKEWLKVSDYTKEESEESVCGLKSSVGATAGIAAMFMVWQFMNVIKNRKLTNEIIIQTNPPDMLTRTFNQ